MTNKIEQFEVLLNEEDDILTSLVEKHDLMHKCVKEKDWEQLLSVTSEINVLYEAFQEIDTSRDFIQSVLKVSELQPYFEKIGLLRSKLLKCKIENQALSKYVNVTREFIQGIVENALPQSGSKVYSKTGKIVQSRPQSVVLNMSF